MTLALQTNTEQVARDYDIPAATIKHWFGDAGGIVECRRWLDEQVLAAYLRSRQAIFNEVAARADKLGEEQLMETYRKLAQPADAPTGAVAGAVAMAKTEVHIHLDDATG